MNDVAAACGEAPGCGNSEGSCNNLCGPAGRVWLGAEWLYWTTKGNFLPPLATFAPAGTPRGLAGTLGGPGTQIRIGDQGVNHEWRSGLRVYGGIWLDPDQTRGLEGDFIYLGQSRQTQSVGSNGSESFFRPFINNTRETAPGTFVEVPPFQDTQLVSFPNTLSGTMTVNTGTDFIGGGGNFVRNLFCNPCARIDLLLGYRYLNLTDTLDIEENLTALPGNPRNGTTFNVQDRFRTENHFHGGVLGLAYERRFSRFFVGVRSSVAMGVNHSVVSINGATVVTDPNGARQTLSGGLLAQPSNIGRYTNNSFAVVPEIGLKLGAQLTDHLRVFGGYNFLYWNNVTRTGEVLDLRVNGSQSPPRLGQTGALFPQFNPRKTDFFAHGLSIGGEFRY
jgi:hypothetical protein